MSESTTQTELGQVLDAIKSMQSDIKAVQVQLYDLTIEVRTNQATTNEKFNTLEERLSGEIKAVRTELKGEIKAVDDKLSSQIKAVDDKLSNQIQSVDEKLTTQLKAVDDKVTDLKIAKRPWIPVCRGSLWHWWGQSLPT